MFDILVNSKYHNKNTPVPWQLKKSEKKKGMLRLGMKCKEKTGEIKLTCRHPLIKQIKCSKNKIREHSLPINTIAAHQIDRQRTVNPTKEDTIMWQKHYSKFKLAAIIIIEKNEREGEDKAVILITFAPRI